MPVYSHLHQLFNVNTCHAYIHTLRWKDRPLQCPRCQSQDVGLWAITTIGQGSNVTGATAVDAPSTTSPTHCSPRANDLSSTGSSPPSCCASRVVSSHRQRVKCPCPDQLSLVLVAAQCRPVL